MGKYDKNNAAEGFHRATYNSIEPFFNNYKAHVKAKDVEPYWNLTPEVLGLG